MPVILIPTETIEDVIEYNRKVIDDPHCTSCGEDDTVTHFFFSCSNVNNCWNSFGNWWKHLYKKVVIIETETMIFGVPDRTPDAYALNYCLIVARYYIYQTKKNTNGKGYPTLYNFLCLLKRKLELLYLNSKMNMTLDTFDNKWGSLFYSL